MRFGHGELHLVLLALLASGPRNGYELMSELASRIPRYKASPGSVYPAISALQAEGLIEASIDGERKSFNLTSGGEEALKARSSRLAALEARLGVRFQDGLDAVLARFSERVRSVSSWDDDSIRAVERVLDEAAEEIEKIKDRRN